MRVSKAAALDGYAVRCLPLFSSGSSNKLSHCLISCGLSRFVDMAGRGRRNQIVPINAGIGLHCSFHQLLRASHKAQIQESYVLTTHLLPFLCAFATETNGEDVPSRFFESVSCG
jgi:hypothetical protein